MAEYVAYIDEAGDEGFDRLGTDQKTAQSQWFAIGGIIVSKENDRLLPSWRDEVLNYFPRKKTRELHFRELKHDQRLQTCRILSTKPIGMAVVCSNKITLLGHPKRNLFRQKQRLYNYLTRFLLERLTFACRQHGIRNNSLNPSLRIVFSRRRGTDYAVMKEYLCLMRDGKEVLPSRRQILWDVFDPSDIAVEDHSKRAGLQIADVFTSAVWRALEPNEYGFSEHSYANTLSSRFLRENGSILGAGLTLIPNHREMPLSNEQLEFIEHIRKR